MCSHFLFICDWSVCVEFCCFVFVFFPERGVVFIRLSLFFPTSLILNNSPTLSLCCSTCTHCHFHSASWFVTGRGASQHGSVLWGHCWQQELPLVCSALQFLLKMCCCFGQNTFFWDEWFSSFELISNSHNQTYHANRLTCRISIYPYQPKTLISQ